MSATYGLPLDVRLWRRALYSTITGCRSIVTYAREHGIDLDITAAHASVVTVVNCTFSGTGWFDIDPKGEPSIVIEVLAEDAETIIDLCAWPINGRRAFATAIGDAVLLGHANILNPASWAFGGRLRIHRHPFDWLRAGCSGCMILDHRVAPYHLAHALGPLEAEDVVHATELKRWLCRAPVHPHNIVLPTPQVRRAA